MKLYEFYNIKTEKAPAPVMDILKHGTQNVSVLDLGVSARQAIVRVNSGKAGREMMVSVEEAKTGVLDNPMYYS